MAENKEEKKFNLAALQEAEMEKHYILTPEEKKTSKYGKLVFEFPKEDNEVVAEGDPMDFVAHPQAYFRGAMQIPGAEFNQSYQIFKKPFFLDRVQHRHAKDEYLIFLGAANGPDGYADTFAFDAHIEFTLGKGEDAETYVIDKPTIIRIPAGMYHCPLNFKRVDKPVLFLATLLQPMFGGIYDMPDGSEVEMYYNGPVQCKYNADKKCDACGKCLQEKWEK